MSPQPHTHRAFWKEGRLNSDKCNSLISLHFNVSAKNRKKEREIERENMGGEREYGRRGRIWEERERERGEREGGKREEREREYERRDILASSHTGQPLPGRGL